jgi:hypothetical protein
MENNSNINFILPSDWFLQRPIDFEHKQYVLSSLLVKVEDALSRGELYPYFTELSLHMASIGSFLKNNSYYTIDKNFHSVDDEVMLYELKPKKNRKKFTEPEYAELVKILAYSHEKLLQYFSICKSVWDLSFDATSIKLRKNKKKIDKKKSYVVYQDNFNNQQFVWETDYIVNSEKKGDTYMLFNLIYSGDNKTFTEVVKDHSTTQKIDIPIFEVFSSQNFPLESTLLPLFKRKIHSYFTQTL